MAQTPSTAADPYESLAAAPAAAVAASSSDSDPYASIATPTTPTTPPEPPSLISRVGSGALDVAKGIGEGAVTGMGETVQSIPFIGKHIITPEAMADERRAFAPGGTAEKAGQFGGQAGESVLEFVLGDEALKGLSIAKKLGIAAKVADLANESPYLAKLLEHGTLAARQGTVGTTAALAHGATLPKALETGAAAAVAAPIVEAGLGAASRFRPKNPFRASADAIKNMRSDIPVATSKIEPAVAARTAKAGLAPGEAGLTPEAAAAQTTQSAIEAKATTQANVDQAIQGIATHHATANNIPAPAVGTASRDVITNNGNALVTAGKADYKILDKFTEGKFTNAQNELGNAQRELQQKAGTTSADTPTLEANVIRAQMNVDNLFDKAVENGMPKETAEAARTKFRTGQATLDAGNDVRMSNRARGAAGTRTTDLNALENRWTARYDAGRLQQAFGEQGAKNALASIRAAREAGEVFESLPPTESQALRDLIQKNTTTGKFGTTTHWNKVRDAFSSLPDRAARFSNVPKVEKFINDQLFYQRVRQGAVGLGATAVGGAAGAVGYKAVQ